MKPILALDISGTTGWAYGPGDGTPAYGTKCLKFEGVDIGRLMHEFGSWLDDMITFSGAQHVVFEAPFIQQKKVMPARKLICLAGEVERVCFLRDVTTGEVEIQDNKRFFAGSHRASKYQMTLAARRFGWDPKNNDESDALGLWSYSVNIRHPQAFADRKLQADMGGVKA